jgi:integrase/recombinase XerD
MTKNKKGLTSPVNQNQYELDVNLASKFEKASKQKLGVEDFVQDFIHQFISEQTKKAYLGDLDSFFQFLKSGNVTIQNPNEITGYHFQFYRDHLMEAGYSSATLNRKLVAIRSFIKWAMAAKLIDHNPLDIVKLPKVQTETPTVAFTDEEVMMIINSPDLNTAKGYTHRFAMIMLFSLGLRRSELAGIRVKDIYQERNHYVLKITGKGNKHRHLPVQPQLMLELQNYLNALAKVSIQLSPDDYLIQSLGKTKNAKPIDGSTIYRIIVKYAKVCGINKQVSPHSCRATAISHLLDTQKTPIRDVAIFAGHSKITTTERYDKRRESLDQSAAYMVDYDNKAS